MKYSLEQYQNSLTPLDILPFWSHWSRMPGVNQTCLSQWYFSPFVAKGEIYKTAEHFMMAEKARIFGDETIRQQILRCDSPQEAKRLGKQIINFKEEEWGAWRYGVVLYGNLSKFQQHSSLTDYLVGTGNKIIAEASPVDQIWGIGLHPADKRVLNVNEWNGLNLLGFALMEVRDRLQGK